MPKAGFFLGAVPGHFQHVVPRGKMTRREIVSYQPPGQPPVAIQINVNCAGRHQAPRQRRGSPADIATGEEGPTGIGWVIVGFKAGCLVALCIWWGQCGL